MSPRHWSPSANFLPSFICSDKLTSLSIWFARCNKGGKKTCQHQHEYSPKAGCKHAAAEVRQQDRNSKAASVLVCEPVRQRLPVHSLCYLVPEQGFRQAGPGCFSVFDPPLLPLHAPGATHAPSLHDPAGTTVWTCPYCSSAQADF